MSQEREGKVARKERIIIFVALALFVLACSFVRAQAYQTIWWRPYYPRGSTGRVSTAKDQEKAADLRYISPRVGNLFELDYSPICTKRVQNDEWIFGPDGHLVQRNQGERYEWIVGPHGRAVRAQRYRWPLGVFAGNLADFVIAAVGLTMLFAILGAMLKAIIGKPSWAILPRALLLGLACAAIIQFYQVCKALFIVVNRGV